ncbi:MAG TPA: G1 family glutamic endopeptidase [Candidatus Dormibacteraeota bacterium]|nr:G1 family glutamic endopeptidase [Candidatus Dormibacteraeota bacterium]
MSAGLLGSVTQRGLLPVRSEATASSTLFNNIASNAAWSGYVEESGSDTRITGTFTVPSLTTPILAGTNLSEWVGVDGYGNSSLIQAGVDEYPDASAAGGFDVMPWWEIVPAPETPISLATAVRPGDSLTVVIGQLSGTLWQITLTDNTTGHSFSTVQTYSGPGGTAEWIVEAPTDSSTGQVYPLASYSPTTFSAISDNGPNSLETGLAIVQNGADVSSPSALGSGGTSFTMTYGSSNPVATLAGRRPSAAGLEPTVGGQGVEGAQTLDPAPGEAGCLAGRLPGDRPAAIGLLVLEQAIKVGPDMAITEEWTPAAVRSGCQVERGQAVLTGLGIPAKLSSLGETGDHCLGDRIRSFSFGIVI